MRKSISWDDWRLVEAIAENGTTARAAAALGLNQSTVFRRISQFEDDLGVRLFTRDKSGFRLTLHGERVLPDIRKLASMANDIERQVAGLDEVPAGEVRLSVNATIVRYLIPGVLARFRRDYPNIRIRLDLTDQIVNLREQGADLVIRGSNDPDPDLFGRRLMRLHFAAYTCASGDDLKRQAADYKEDPGRLEWIGWDGSLRRTFAWRKAEQHFLSNITPGITATDVETTAYLCASGAGCAFLPCFLGDRHPELSRISEIIPSAHTELWVLTHNDLRRTARVSALLRYIGSHVTQAAEVPVADRDVLT
ncbi:MAG: LysR family transcriptional regulator [Pseudomonadota bacterium]